MPAEVGGRHADDDRQHGGEEAGDQRDHQRLPGAVDELGPDVLAERRRAEQVLAGGRQAGRERQLVRVAHRGEQLRHDGQHAEDERSSARPSERLAAAARPRPTVRRRPGAGPAGAGGGGGVDEQCGHRGYPFVPGPRVEPGDRDVAEQDGDQHGDREQHEQRLHQRVVGVLHGVVEQVAQAGVVEDVLDQDRAGDHEAERHREPGQVGQERVAGRVRVMILRFGQALGPAHPDVVLGQRGDHVVAHGQDPAADRGDEDRRRRQDGVLQHAADEAGVNAGCRPCRS